ncbi:hypothetical protein TWF730_006973 [Orbilia blumenaviensis]|uniref:Uncharacterized protein n=1 Tax=Orbilia blumenaviensis TaxID=1796055 RepID=A0AAV9VHB4_9PEZI
MAQSKISALFALIFLLFTYLSLADVLNVTIHTPTDNLYLQRSSSGSLTIWQYKDSPPPSTFVSNDSFISRDTDGRYLIYFPSEIQATNLSRILLQPIDKIPIGARGFRLSYMQGSAGLDGVFIGTDIVGNGMYIVACVPQYLNNNITILAAKNSPFPPEVQFTSDSNLPYLPFTTLGFPHDGCQPVTFVTESEVAPLAWGSVAPSFEAISEADTEYIGGISSS